jgi:hypothetical protein
MATLVMVAGYQRSGTTVLIESFEALNPECTFNESPDNAAFTNKNLHRKDVLLPIAEALGGTLIVKPNKLFHHNTVDEVLDRYRRFRVRIIWAFRDPVETYISNGVMRRKRGHTEDQPVEEFADKWIERNEKAIDAFDRRLTPVKFVNYNTIAERTEARELQLSKFTGRPVKLLHDGSQASRRAAMAPDKAAAIDQLTSTTLGRLVERTKTPKSAATPL